MITEEKDPEHFCCFSGAHMLFSIVIYRSYDLKRREMNLRISLAENKTSAQYAVPAEEAHTEEESGSQGMLDELLLPILNFIEALISRILSGLLGLLL